MTEQELSEIEARANNVLTRPCPVIHDYVRIADLALETIPALLAEVRSARAEIERLRAMRVVGGDMDLNVLYVEVPCVRGVTIGCTLGDAMTRIAEPLPEPEAKPC